MLKVPDLSVVYPLPVGAVVSALFVWPMGIGGSAEWGAWLYVALAIALVTFALDRLLRIPFRRRTVPAAASVVIPIAASAIGIVAGWWAVNKTMGGPV